MKKVTILSTLLFTSSLFVGTAHAQHYGGGTQYYDYAKVVKVVPIYRMVRINQPRRVCWNERVPHRAYYNGSATPTIVGGIIGGAVGNRFGRGRGRDVATIAGVILGSSIARDMQRTSQGVSAPYVESRRVCGVRDHYVEQERLDGYRISYRYRGRIYTTTMDRDPGKRVRVNVSVSLAE